MSCCGSKRENYVQPVANSLAQQVNSPVPAKMWPDVNFEYTGETGLTVTGNVTGKRYRFSSKGEIQLVDYRDASGMMAVPVLKKIN
jgi:hypothetical protein